MDCGFAAFCASRNDAAVQQKWDDRAALSVLGPALHNGF
jgi:hypothetical protein